MHAVAAVPAVQNLRPPLRCHIPPALARLLGECWHRDPDARPSFAQVVGRLEAAQRGLGAAREEEEQEAEELGCEELPGFPHAPPGMPTVGSPSMFRDSVGDSLEEGLGGSDSLGGWKRVPLRPQGILPRLLVRRHDKPPGLLSNPHPRQLSAVHANHLVCSIAMGPGPKGPDQLTSHSACAKQLCRLVPALGPQRGKCGEVWGSVREPQSLAQPTSRGLCRVVGKPLHGAVVAARTGHSGAVMGRGHGRRVDDGIGRD